MQHGVQQGAYVHLARGVLLPFHAPTRWTQLGLGLFNLGHRRPFLRVLLSIAPRLNGTSPALEKDDCTKFTKQTGVWGSTPYASYVNLSDGTIDLG